MVERLDWDYEADFDEFTVPPARAAYIRGEKTMTSPFVPAETIQKKLKVLASGDSGSGKTFFALTFPQKVAVIDTEGGTDLYGGRADIPPFDVLHSKSFEEVMKALDFIEADAGHTYQTVALDPITVIYQVLQEARAINSKDGALTYRDWGVIKSKMNRLYVRLTNMPVHVVVTSRQKDEYSTNGKDLIKIGVKPDSERATPYLFDINLRLYKAGGSYAADVTKDRSGSLPDTILNPSYALLSEIAANHANGKTRPEIPDDDVAAQEAAQMAREEHWTATQNWGKFWGYVEGKLGLSREQAHEALGVTSAIQFAGTKDEAMAALQAYAARLHGEVEE